MKHVRISKTLGLLVAVGWLVFGLFTASPALAVDSYCFCHKDISVITPDTLNQYSQKDDSFWKSGCPIVPDASECQAMCAKGGYEVYDRLYISPTDCSDAKNIFDAQFAQRIGDAKQAGLNVSKSKFIPQCALEDKLSDECKDISIFVILAIRVADYMFSIIGALALLVFIYGGFRLILSQGSAENIDAGKNAMLAAVTGLAVAFGGYLLIQFVAGMIGATTPLL